jgi:surfeit locus 1 family protein
MSTAQSPTKTKTKRESIPLSKLPRALISRQWWWTTILVLLGLAVLVRLGVWQLDRLAQRRAGNAVLIEQLTSSPFSLNSDQLPADLADLRDRPAVARGRFDFEQQLVLTQQSWGGFPGVHLITPLLLDGSDGAVLVDRGWIPAEEAAAGELERYNEAKIQIVNGAFQLSQTLSGGRETVTDGPQQEWYRVEIEAIQRQLPYELLPIYMLQSPGSEEQELPYKIEPEIDLSEGPHLGYAIQWFIFATILVFGYGYYVITRSGPPKPGSPV